MPKYPSYPTQPFTGNLPSMWSKYNRASDLTYTSSTAPHYQSKIDAAHGRRLAGTDDEVQDEQSEQGWAANELAVMAEMDDVQNDGIFDPPGTRPNIYPDAGILAARFDIPGYLARERMYAKSEVIDSTTGRPVVYVNGGAVSMDSAAQIAFLERGMYAPSQPVIGAARARDMAPRSIVNVRVSPQAIGQEAPATGMPVWQVLALTGAVGLGLGALYQVIAGKKKKA
jgi:hypothetical protein